jgi:hypothetical protein
MPDTGTFVSYSSLDREFARRLVDELRLRGVTARWDQDFPAGTDRDTNMTREIEASTYFIALLSPAWYDSDYCQAENRWARERSMALRPIRLRRGTAAQELAFRETWFDLCAGDMNDVLARLFAAVRAAGDSAQRRVWAPAARKRNVAAAPAPAVRLRDGDTASSVAPRFDIGTIWGLTRLPFVGVLAAPADLAPIDILRRAEGVVEDASFQRLTGLRDRWWLHCDASLYPHGPRVQSDVWEAARKVRVGSLEPDAGGGRGFEQSVRALGDAPLDLGFPQHVAFGVVIGFDVVGPEAFETARRWCSAVRKLLASREPAVVVHVAASGTDAGDAAALELARILESTDAVRVEVLRWAGAPARGQGAKSGDGGAIVKASFAIDEATLRGIRPPP